MEDPLDFYIVDIAEVKEALENSDTAAATEKIQECLEKQEKIPLNIAITGESGAGKSTFINAFRGIDHKDERAARTGAVETTMEVTKYPHPNYPNVLFWDLPGIGTTNFPADEYLKKMEFEKFDFFIIISDTRFRENDVKLALEIQKMEKKFYFVRSKIDNDVRAEERTQKDFSLEKSLKRIKENCIQGKIGFCFVCFFSSLTSKNQTRSLLRILLWTLINATLKIVMLVYLELVTLV